MKIKKEKAAPAGAGTASNTESTRNNYNIRPRVKAAIVRLALWGVLPVKFAEWLIHLGGLKNV